MWLDIVSVLSGAQIGLYLASKLRELSYHASDQQQVPLDNARVDRLMAENKRLLELNALLLEENRALCDRILRVAFSDSSDSEMNDDAEECISLPLCSCKGHESNENKSHDDYVMKTPNKVK